MPDLEEKLRLVERDQESKCENSVTAIEAFDWPSRSQVQQSNAISVSPRGHNYTGLGCFQLGLDCSLEDFEDVVETQRRLRDLKLLKTVNTEELDQLRSELLNSVRAYELDISNEEELNAINELAEALSHCRNQDDDPIKVYIALHSGLRTSLTTQFWGVYDNDSVSGTTNIYVSAKTPDLAGTVLHTFMSSRGVARLGCFFAEYIFSSHTGHLTEPKLAPRINLDIEQLTPAETILLLQRLGRVGTTDHVELLERVRSFCEYRLMEVPSLIQLRSLCGAQYLRGDASAEDLIQGRLAWYREQGCLHPEPSIAIATFTAIDIRIQEVLMSRQGHILSQLQHVLHKVLHETQIDASADIFALAIFCAFRKLALNEVYMEVLERNPLPNSNSDQAACFAEMFATGSQCGAYFDMTPNVLGKIIADKYNIYYKANQPPLKDDHSTELPTAYASKQVDIDPEAEPLKLPIYYQITFLGIFAVPALIDILLLTTIGRGLYLTAYMTSDEKLMATTALMIALFLVGAIGTWISTGGSYYLHSMAFPAMNMYVISRLIAGVAVCLAGGFLAFIVIGIIKGFYLALVFFLYFFFLSTYLTILATLAIYQLPGFMFQSVSLNSHSN